eukprot:CAMPEP_0168340356 /NCGR_PEP_ID=MMETSP0213-20121227/14017_1 /TAXON_ID=151035 /ORGANISM="Euplotes harpa, Strain FSP1.4" /LENGTH=160 /DNA_ID=CAMNT_0008346581 /DNA_START=184 /DNA_END=666 /DNA_ORIENTATION=+
MSSAVCRSASDSRPVELGAGELRCLYRPIRDSIGADFVSSPGRFRRPMLKKTGSAEEVIGAGVLLGGGGGVFRNGGGGGSFDGGGGGTEDGGGGGVLLGGGGGGVFRDGGGGGAEEGRGADVGGDGTGIGVDSDFDSSLDSLFFSDFSFSIIFLIFIGCQ